MRVIMMNMSQESGERKTTQEILIGFKPLTLYRLYGESCLGKETAESSLVSFYMKRKLIPLTEPKNELFPLCVTLFVPGDNVLMHASGLRFSNLPFLGTIRDYSQLSLRQTPLGPAISVRLREMFFL